MRRVRQCNLIVQSEVSRSAEALVDVPLFTTPYYRSVQDAYKSRRHFRTGVAGSQAQGSGVHLEK